MSESKKKDEKKIREKTAQDSINSRGSHGDAPHELPTIEQLRKHFDEAEWAWIKPHTERGIVIVVDEFLDLLQVGEAIASDRSVEVQKWINQNLLTKPTPQHIINWDANPKERFLCLVVQPYILIQDLQKAKVKH